MSTDEQRRRGFRISLILVFLVCVGPFAGAWFWYATMGPPTPDETTNHGELIRPARPLENVELPVIAAREDHEGRLPAYREGRWTVVYIARDGCGETCRETLWSVRQIRLSLGRDMGRVQRVLLLPGEAADPGFYRDEHDDLRVLDLAGEEADALLRQFELEGDGEAGEQGRLYIIDPLGNLMMYFPAGFDPDHFMDDMKRLLRVSQIG